MKQKFAMAGALALALVTMLGACAAPDDRGGASAGAGAGSSKVQAYGVIDGGVTLVK
ncbi:hypothetical protein HUS70_10080 [Pandoraea nosoerga]|uniref:Lipoprotein n=1 Tax=Pandoraea nosoerga TaxID=2508296 RepID=A0A5E4W8H1_9BURK|nr:MULTISPECIES: hypothetical protein [Pandoraea]MBN4667750.1 hypothetical protein [Pandoraea nosoerga]MBN4677649.1 hypothetical protein [Pandoraea nosoerga]MBN4682571.1 hypothetical protein [Pandoraea nosoerga]MBN4744986.1 hypothetical protein [Pandoraea nosoerga]VVE19560.1 hypothetical protein PNO31109_03057 [Pandoraea nosoerga]